MEKYNTYSFNKNYTLLKNKYICLEGFFINCLIATNNEKHEFDTGIFGYILQNKNDETGVIVGKSVIDLLKRINELKYQGNIRIIGKPATCLHNFNNINNILKVELLDEQGNVIKTAKAEESTIPKELRDKI